MFLGGDEGNAQLFTESLANVAHNMKESQFVGVSRDLAQNLSRRSVLEAHVNSNLTGVSGGDGCIGAAHD